MGAKHLVNGVVTADVFANEQSVIIAEIEQSRCMDTAREFKQRLTGAEGAEMVENALKVNARFEPDGRGDNGHHVA